MYIVKRKLQSAVGGGGDGEVSDGMGVPGATGAAGIPGVAGVPGIPGMPGAVGVAGISADLGSLQSLIEHIQTSTAGLVLNYDSLTVNHLIVRTTLKIPSGTDKYPNRG